MTGSSLSSAPAAFAASPAIGLICRECGKQSQLAPVHVCDNCFAPLEVEYDYDVEADGRTGTVGNVLVVRVRDGHIVGSRDYHDHQAMTAILTG